VNDVGNSQGNRELVLENDGYYFELKPSRNNRVKLKFGSERKTKKVELDVDSLRKIIKLISISKGTNRSFSFIAGNSLRVTIKPDGVIISDLQGKVSVFLRYSDVENIEEYFELN